MPTTGELVGGSIGEALVPTLLAFAISALVYQKARGVMLATGRLLAMGLLSWLLLAGVNIVVYVSEPHLFGSSEFGYLTIVQILVAPVLVSIGVLTAFEPAAAPDADTAAPAVKALPVVRQPTLAAAPAATDAPRSLLATPAQRAGFVAMVAGLVVFAATFVTFEVSDEYTGFVAALTSRPGRYGGYKLAAAVGLVLAAGGALIAFAYAATIGRVVSWVKTGT